MSCLRKHIKRLKPSEGIASIEQNARIPREGRRIAREIDYSLWGERSDPLHDRFAGPFARGIEKDLGVRRLFSKGAPRPLLGGGNLEGNVGDAGVLQIPPGVLDR